MTKEEYLSLLNYKCLSPIVRKGFEQLIQEHFEPKPYKYEDLKDEMWVWDDKEQICCEIGIDEDGLLMVYWYDDDLFNIKQMTYIEFEENRFYPLEKAREYE